MTTNTSNTYLITSDAEAGTLETLPTTTSLNILSVNELANKNLRFSEKDKICISSEASLDSLMSRIDDERKINAILKLKDKFFFRKILCAIYPDYTFQRIDIQDIKDLKIVEKSVIKPIKGCFGTAVRVIEPHTDLVKLSADLATEIQKNGAILSDNVLSKTDFMVEQFIEGEEYAVDMFYNEVGEPCIVNIYHHPMPHNLAYLHVIYYSSKTVFDKIYEKAKYFFTELNKILKVKNFAMHSEFKLNEKGLFPIEINSMRFGGMGLGNMVFHALGVNPYQYYNDNCEPNWKSIWETKTTDNFAYFIAYNALNKSTEDHKPDIPKLRKQFTKILLDVELDYQNQLAFGLFCLQESDENITELLKIEFDDYFDKID